MSLLRLRLTYSYKIDDSSELNKLWHFYRAGSGFSPCSAKNVTGQSIVLQVMKDQQSVVCFSKCDYTNWHSGSVCLRQSVTRIFCLVATIKYNMYKKNIARHKKQVFPFLSSLDKIYIRFYKKMTHWQPLTNSNEKGKHWEYHATSA